MKTTEVTIFYSSRKEPDFFDAHFECIEFLRKHTTKIKIIDIMKKPKLAEKNMIIDTPSVIIRKECKKYRYPCAIDGLKDLFMEDQYGKSILLVLGFKEGRELGKNIKLIKREDKIENVLNEVMGSRGLHDLRLVSIDRKERYAKLKAVSDIAKVHGKSKMAVCFEVIPFLGGIFTEIFDAGVHFKETKCIAQGYGYCEFETIKEDVKKTKEALKKWL